MKALLLILFFVAGYSFTSPAQQIKRPDYHRSNRPTLFKSGAGDLYVPDSITVYSPRDTTLELPEYSPKGAITFDLIKIWADSSWMPFYSYECFFDDHGYPNLYIDQEWTDSGWVNSYRYAIEWDSMGHVLADLYEEWSGNEWVNYDRILYSYDQDWNQVSGTYQIWSSDSWTNSDKTDYTYDAHGNVITETHQSWLNGLWHNETRYSYTYDSHNNNLHNLAEIWEGDHWETNGQWRNSYTYDSQGRILTIIGEHEIGDWEIANRETYTYDIKGQKTSYLAENWIDGAWQNRYHSTFYYDQLGHIILQEFFVWDSDSAKWGDSETEPFILTVNGQEQWSFSSGNKMIAHWVKLGGSGVPDYPAIEIGIGPNPVESTLWITGDVQVIKTEVFTIHGEQLEINQSGDPNSVDVSNLPAGLYLLKVTTRKGTIIKRFVKG